MDTNLCEKPVSEGKRRLQFDFSQDAMARVESMKKEASAKTYAQLVNDALRFYEWFLTQKREGRAIMVRDGNKVKEIEFIF